MYATKEEQTILLAIYHYRTLTIDLLSRFIMKEDEVVTLQRLKEMESSRWVVLDEESEKGNYFITHQGIQQICHLLEEEEPLKAYKLKIKPRFLNHQLHLNAFVLQFFEQNEWATHHELVSYQDEARLNATHYNNFRPDGLLKIGDWEILLEMDMGTERPAAIKKKMERYFRFKQKAMLEERKVLILFICHKTHTPYMLNQIYQAISSEINVFHQTFDLIIGDFNKLLNYLKNESKTLLTSTDEIYRRWTLEKYQAHFPASFASSKVNSDTLSRTYFDYVITPRRATYQNYLVIDLRYLRFSRLKTWHYCDLSLSNHLKKFSNIDETGILVLYSAKDEALVQSLAPTLKTDKVTLLTHEVFMKQGSACLR